jgi:hypothetical protein
MIGIEISMFRVAAGRRMKKTQTNFCNTSAFITTLVAFRITSLQNTPPTSKQTKHSITANPHKQTNKQQQQQQQRTTLQPAASTRSEAQ